MNLIGRILFLCVFGVALQMAAHADGLPYLKKNGGAVQLMLDGEPFLALAGELHNSSASSPQYMAPIWPQLAKNGLNTVIGTASWELLEPDEGRYDFVDVDDQIKQARVQHLRLVLIWFGAYKNAESTYAPSWVRRDEVRFPRGLRDPTSKPTGNAAFLKGPRLSVFSDNLVSSDARAFAALMRHIRAVDHQHTVVMMQVENETGIVGTPRDHSAIANAAWDQAVPAALMGYLIEHRADLDPALRELWGRQGFRSSGTWPEVFGLDASADEVFMAWAFGSYVNRVAKSGAAEYPLPMYANAWLGPQPGSTRPGDYPSGGPVARMMDVWKAAAPQLALLAPDIYIDDFDGTLNAYQRLGNPIFIPEARFNAGNLFVAIGEHNVICFSPFGIEDGKTDDDVFQAYRILKEMVSQVTSAQAEGRVHGFSVQAGSPRSISLAGYDLTIGKSANTLGIFGPGTGTESAAPSSGYGLVISMGGDDFLMVARGVSPRFSVGGVEAEIDSAQEGAFRHGQWVPGRTLNGDERFFLFPDTALRVVRMRLLRHRDAQ